MTSFESLAARGLSVARGLVFAFLVYFVTAFLRDLAGFLAPSVNLVDALSGTGIASVGPCLAVSVATMALAVLFVRLYSRTGPAADDPVPLLRLGVDWWREWTRGLLIGAGLASLAVAPAIAAGEIEILGMARDAFAHPGRLLGSALILTLEAAREEFGFRGPAQRELTRALSFPVAAVVLAGSFALVHAGNPAVGGAGMTAVFAAGLALAGLARARGDLGMVCGVHAAWNVTLGIAWSVPVSGLRLQENLLETSSNTSAWTGGLFGPEAGIPAIVVLFLFAVTVWRLPAASCARTRAGKGGATS